MAPRREKLQLVWPKDRKGKKGKWHRFRDIVAGKGPDIYITPQTRDRSAIPVDQWTNWYSFADEDCKNFEARNPMPHARRGNQRYDPISRRYVEWDLNDASEGREGQIVPRLTKRELATIDAEHARRGPFKLRHDIFENWDEQGPLRFEPTLENQQFWSKAHRRLINNFYGLDSEAPAFLSMPADFFGRGMEEAAFWARGAGRDAYW